MRRRNKAQVSGVTVKLVIALIVIGMLAYLGYKYILGTGQQIGGLSKCTSQGGDCVKTRDDCKNGITLSGLCEEKEGKFCCIKEGGGGGE